jgi:hypothetical protein
VRYEWENEITEEFIADMLKYINDGLPDNISAIGIAFAETEEVEGGLHIIDDIFSYPDADADVLKDINGDAARIYKDKVDLLWSDKQ